MNRGSRGVFDHWNCAYTALLWFIKSSIPYKKHVACRYSPYTLKPHEQNEQKDCTYPKHCNLQGSCAVFSLHNEGPRQAYFNIFSADKNMYTVYSVNIVCCLLIECIALEQRPSTLFAADVYFYFRIPLFYCIFKPLFQNIKCILKKVEQKTFGTLPPFSNFFFGISKRKVLTFDSLTQFSLHREAALKLSYVIAWRRRPVRLTHYLRFLARHIFRFLVTQTFSTCNSSSDWSVDNEDSKNIFLIAFK